MGKEFTCKDFRTYSANIIFIEYFLKYSKSNTSSNNSSNSKKLILKCIDSTAKKLGHTRNICKKSYISNNLINYCLDSPSEASEESVKSLFSKL